MYFNVISSGSKGNATIVVADNKVILIDMGVPLVRLESGMEEIGLTPKDIDFALFTHNHSDHIRGLNFLPIKKQYALHRTLPTSGYNILEVNAPLIIDNLSITPIRTSHDAINPCGYLIKDKEESLFYMTDTGMFLEENLSLVKNPTYLIIESNHDIQMLMKTNRPMELKQRILSDVGHLCNEDSALAALAIVGQNTKEIVLAHLSEEANTPTKAIEAYKKIFSYFNHDLDRYLLRCAHQHHSLIGGNYED